VDNHDTKAKLYNPKTNYIMHWSKISLEKMHWSRRHCQRK